MALFEAAPDAERIAQLEKKAAADASKISALRTRVAELEKKAKKAKKKAEDNKGDDVVALQAKIDSLERENKFLKERLDHRPLVKRRDYDTSEQGHTQYHK